ncbi:site-specific integrase [Pseudophaeobacter sp.]|uniref:site-specific integrase n=1 Tax=Pseudophaeobacter sp. TaxID=1971739 RepID=UPI00405A4029
MKSRDGAAMVQEHRALMAEFEKLVSVARGENSPTPREQWQADKSEAEAMLAAISGLPDEDDRRDILGEELIKASFRSSLVNEVLSPDSKGPKHTLEDARRLYLSERIGGDRPKTVRLERICARITDALGPLNDFPLVDLKREHARSLRDAMLSATKKNGEPLSVASVKRELNMVTAMVGLGIREFDLSDRLSNPFEKLDMPKATQVASARDDRDPLPADVIKAMRTRLETSCKSPDLARIWHLLVGTGCRLAEVSGLLVEDVVLEHEVPHLIIRPNAVRSLKTRSSIRKVPIVSKALEAAREAVSEVKRRGDGPALFPTYAKPRGADGASQALMKHLRAVTSNPRHTNHSLRHSMKDWLREAGVPSLEQNLILGHTLGGEGDTAYGGELAKLRVTQKALQKVVELGLMA